MANDNRRPAGRLEGDTLKVSLRAGRGSWQPEGPDGPRLSIEAFGEDASPLMVPAPLIRAEAGTLIDVTLRNDLDVPLQVRGLCARDGAACPPLAVPPRDTRQVQFRIDQPGTYHYWATTMGAPVPFRELAGGLIVDPRGARRRRSGARHHRVGQPDAGAARRSDARRRSRQGLRPVEAPAHVRDQRPLLAGDRAPDLSRRRDGALARDQSELAGASRCTCTASTSRSTALGDGLKDTPIAPADRHPVVTQLLPPAATMSMTWTPERAGNWLFHCHLMHHVSTERRLHRSRAGRSRARRPRRVVRDGRDDSRRHGSRSRSQRPSERRRASAPRKMTLTMERRNAGGEPGFGFGLSGDRVPSGLRHGGRARTAARAQARRAGGDHRGEPPRRAHRACTGTAWSSSRTTTACTTGAASIASWRR